ncbi:c-type cytochrome [Vibrio rotiferianus]|uniref:c-type cytochrome n=1 Tax=Vibrio rotiferianus TaxID=190895 RepID=UPI0003A759CC|nr:cytochrome c [Vibrio rotiferianus]PIB12582.1 cytochrome c4 [Vibrio rotiferianus CAIM 577 = LMG 21460]
MKRMLILLIVSISFSAFSSPETEKGKALYIAPGKGGCATCHGETGNEPVMPMYPKIGGQNELYLFNQMKDYKMKKRKNGLFMTMEVAMEHYTDEEIRLMAKYLSAVENN